MRDHCPDIEELSAYLDGEMPSSDALELDEHVLNCGSCREKTRRLHSLHNIAVGDEMPPPDLLPAIMEKVECHRHTTEEAGLGWRRWTPVPLALAAGMMLTFGVLLGHNLVHEANGTSYSVTERMRVFDVIPPGGLCVELDACFEVDEK